MRGTNALDDPGADARDGPLDLLVPGRAHDECAPRVDGGEEGVAVLEAALEVLADVGRLVGDPRQLALLHVQPD